MLQKGLLVGLFCCLALMVFSQGRQFTLKDGLSDKAITCWYKDKAGYIWIGTENGLNRYDGYQFEVFLPSASQRNSLSHACVFDIAADKWDNLWIATRNGLSIYHPDSEQFEKLTQAQDSLPSDWVNAVFIGDNPHIWVACDNRDLCAYNPYTCTFTSYPWKSYVARTLPQFAAKTYKNIEKITAVSPQIIGLQTNVGYFHFNTQTHDFQYVSSQNPPQKPFIDREGNTWIANDKGFLQLDPLLPKFFPPIHPHFSLPEITLTDQNGNQWKAIREGGLWLKVKGEKRFRRLTEATDGFLSTSVMDIKEDKAHKMVWIATEDFGLYCYDLSQHTFTLYRHSPDDIHSLPAYIVYQIAQDAQGNMWFATDPGGLCTFDYASAHFLCVNTTSGLPSNVVYGVTCDSRGNLWVTTQKGLAKVALPSRKITAFTAADGIDFPSFKAYLTHSQQGIITFTPPPYGLGADECAQIGWYFYPDSIRENLLPPPVFLRYFHVLDKPLQLPQNIHFCDTITLSYKEDFFSFEMLAINLSRAERNQYAYQLEGYDKEWIYAGTRRYVTYTHVSPGFYTLKIKASNNDGIWNEKGKQWVIHIVPPFWKTPLFYGLMGVLIIGIVSGLYFYQIQNIRKKAALKHENERLKLEFTHKLAEAQMSALRAQMNPHFIFNVLTSINLFIVQNETEKASDYLNQFSNLIRRILDNSRKEWVTLAEELFTLKLYIEIEQLRFSDTFAFEIYVEEGLEADFIEIPSMLIQPYVENAIWHGLMQKKNPPRNVWINIRKIDTHLQIEIRDNGIGRAAAQALKSKSVTTRQSHGLAVTAARISLLKTLYQLDCKVEIEDLAEGTSVQLYWDMTAH